jgi:hypothetical protein
LGFEQGETPESMQPTAELFDSCVAGCILFNVCFFHSFNADLASFGPFLGWYGCQRMEKNKNPEFLSKSLNARQFGKFSSAGPTGPVSFREPEKSNQKPYCGHPTPNLSPTLFLQKFSLALLHSRSVHTFENF